MIGEFEPKDLDQLSFRLKIEGDYSKITSTRLMLIRENGIGITTLGTVKNGEVTFNLKEAQQFMVSGEYDVKLEVILDENRHFVPTTEKLRIKHSPKVEAVTHEVKVDKKPETVVKSVVIPRVESAAEKWTKARESEGCTVIESSDRAKLFAIRDRNKIAEFTK